MNEDGFWKAICVSRPIRENCHMIYPCVKDYEIVTLGYPFEVLTTILNVLVK